MLRSMRVIAFLAVMAIGISLPAGAATKYTETFTTGGNGWTSTPVGVSAAVRYVGGGIRIRHSSAPLSGIYVTLITDTNASSGAFFGNYVAAGIQTIGFSVNATGSVPDNVELFIGATNSGSLRTIKRSFASMLTTTGVWLTGSASLQSAGLGGWTEDPPGCFTDVLANVSTVFLGVDAKLFVVQQYLFDNFFLDGLAWASEVKPSTGETAVISWSDVRSNLTYHLQTATALGGGWSNVTSFTATGSSHSVSAPIVTNQPPAFFRLLQ